MIERFATAFGFLTILPFFEAKTFTPKELARSMGAFPLVGLALGCGLALFHLLFGNHLPPLFEGFAIVTLLAWATGGFHLDGVADTADGLAGGWTPEKAMEIMKDSRVGAVGAMTLILVIMLKGAGYGYLEGSYVWRSLVGVPCIARGCVVYLAYNSRYARPQAGLGTAYTDELDRETFLMAMGWGALGALFLGWIGVLGMVVTLGWMTLLKRYFAKRLGGVTGDVLGFGVETGEIVLLITIHLFAIG